MFAIMCSLFLIYLLGGGGIFLKFYRYIGHCSSAYNTVNYCITTFELIVSKPLYQTVKLKIGRSISANLTSWELSLVGNRIRIPTFPPRVHTELASSPARSQSSIQNWRWRRLGGTPSDRSGRFSGRCPCEAVSLPGSCSCRGHA